MHPPLLNHHERVRRFGTFDWRWDPKPGNPEHVHILGGWAERNIESVRIEPLRRSVNLHHRAIGPFTAWLEELEREGLLDELGPFNGSWVPRFKRQHGILAERLEACRRLDEAHDGRALSNHAWGTVLDFNAARYPLGKPCPPGDIRFELARRAEPHGIAWGGYFHGWPDPMHFELS
jgi:hypothetical protein